MTLVEVVLAVGIFGLVFGTVLKGLVQANLRASWISFDTAASRIAEQRIEQAQNARWEPDTPIDEVIPSNFPTNTYVLDTNPGGSTTVLATSTIQIASVTNGTIVYKVLTSEVKWMFLNRGPFTNSVVTVRSPDQ
ncbi:MAG: type II secretion system protein [Verrucomicrobiae bacterium]|nr:type II secretion system protein [Verrucomicrobiae bacterium]